MQNKTIQEYWSDAKELFRQRAERNEIEFPTGLDMIDEETDGLHKGEIWVIAGKSGGGKTSLMLQMAHAMAKNGKNTILFLTLEMKGWELITRLFCSIHEADYSSLIKGDFPQEFGEKDKQFREMLTNIDFSIFEYGYSFKEIEHIIKTAYEKRHPDVIFIDFIQFIEWMTFKDQRLAITEYIRKLKELAKVYNIGVVICSQLRRLPSGADYNKPPDMIDLMGSGSIEQMSDKVILIFREIKKDIIKTFIKIAKNRQGREICQEVLFQGWFYRFKDLRDKKETNELKNFQDTETQSIIDDFGGKAE